MDINSRIHFFSLFQYRGEHGETTNIEIPDNVPMKDAPKIAASSSRSTTKGPMTPDKKKKKGLFGGLFGKKKQKEVSTPQSKGRKVKG